MAKQKALSAKERTNWANANFLTNHHKLFLYDHFLLKCPIPGTSNVGRPTQALSLRDDSRAKLEFDSLVAGIDTSHLYCNFELRQVAKWLIDNRYADDRVPLKTGEFVCMSITPASMLKKCFGLFPDREPKTITIADRNAYKRLLTLDALYRHVRNSLAHGLYKEVLRKATDGKRKPYLFLQDNNASHQITARMFLSYERLETWGNRLDSLDG